MNRHWVTKGFLARRMHEHHMRMMLGQVTVQLMVRVVGVVKGGNLDQGYSTMVARVVIHVPM